MCGFAAHQNICPISSHDKNIAKNLLAIMNISVCAGVKIFEPYGTETQVLCVDVSFWFGSSSVSTSYLATSKLASVNKNNCLSGDVCLSACWQHLSKTSLTPRSSFKSSGVMMILSLFCVFVLGSWKENCLFFLLTEVYNFAETTCIAVMHFKSEEIWIFPENSWLFVSVGWCCLLY